MKNISQKLKKFEENCLQMAQIEAKTLEEKIEKEIDERISEEILEYQKDAKINLEKKFSKIQKEYNSKIYQMNNNAKISILARKKQLSEQLKKEIIQKITEFTNSEKYLNFLLNNIKEAILVIENTEKDNIKIGLTQRDINKYYKYIKEKFSGKIYSIDNNYIGGSICTNLSKNISADNTLKMLVEENNIE